MKKTATTLYPLFLFLIPFLLFHRSLNYPLLFDDNYWLSTENLFFYYGGDFDFAHRFLAMVTFLWTHEFTSSLAPHRFITLALHGLNGVLLYALLTLMATRFAEGFPETARKRAAFCAALLFILHPVTVYAVSYLSQRSIVMGLLFSFLTVIAFIEGIQKGKRWLLFASAFLYFGVISCKEHFILLPFLSLLLGYGMKKEEMTTQAFIREVSLPALLYFLIMGLTVSVALLQRGYFGAVYEPDADKLLMHLPENIAGKQLHLLSILTQAEMFYRYLLTFFLPLPSFMSADIRLPFVQEITNPPALGALSLWLSAGSVSVITFLKTRKPLLKVALFGFLWMWVLSFTEFSTVRVIEQFVLYRGYIWLPFVSFLFFSLFLMADRLKPVIKVCLLLFFFTFLLFVQQNRLQTFSSKEALWRDAVVKQQYPHAFGNDRAWVNLGLALFEKRETKEAEDAFRKALSFNPHQAEAHLNLGVIFFNKHHYSEAKKQFRAALRSSPSFVLASLNMAKTLFKEKKYEQAIKETDHALTIEPDNAQVLLLQGKVLVAAGKKREALSSFSQAIRFSEGLTEAWFRRGLLFVQLKRYQMAVNDFTRVLAMQPKGEYTTDAYVNRGSAYLLSGEKEKAKEDFTRACARGDRESCRNLIRFQQE